MILLITLCGLLSDTIFCSGVIELQYLYALLEPTIEESNTFIPVSISARFTGLLEKMEG